VTLNDHHLNLLSNFPGPFLILDVYDINCSCQATVPKIHSKELNLKTWSQDAMTIASAFMSSPHTQSLQFMHFGLGKAFDEQHSDMFAPWSDALSHSADSLKSLTSLYIGLPNRASISVNSPSHRVESYTVSVAQVLQFLPTCRWLTTFIILPEWPGGALGAELRIIGCNAQMLTAFSQILHVDHLLLYCQDAVPVNKTLMGCSQLLGNLEHLKLFLMDTAESSIGLVLNTVSSCTKLRSLQLFISCDYAVGRVSSPSSWAPFSSTHRPQHRISSDHFFTWIFPEVYNSARSTS
jgi:hypothetical protein